MFLLEYQQTGTGTLSCSIDRSDPEVDDGLHEGAAPHMEEGPSIAHCWPWDQVSHGTVWPPVPAPPRIQPVLTSGDVGPVTR